MLHKQTVTEETFSLLRFVQEQPSFKEVRLVGGTALALQYGHRRSIDLDFFGATDSSVDEIVEELKPIGVITILKNAKSIKVLTVNGIKVDFVNYAYPWLDEVVLEDGLRMASAKDIAAMKIAAITGRGSKKDFFDLDLLLNHFPLEEIMDFFSKKYADGSIYLALKSLVYFDDADQEPSPYLFTDRSWDLVKNNIEKHQTNYLKKLGA
ncbi:MAG: nucleotidyl transferase AbiEii/AbiGii toxin family protein [Bacteroidia bacterium]